MLGITSHKNKIFILSIILAALFGIVNFFNNEVRFAQGEIKKTNSDKLSKAVISLSASIPRSLHFRIMP